MADYDYQVFISYSSADRPWAVKLYDALQAKGISVFLDQRQLDIGTPWEPSLARAVQSSQHLVVLWTDNANRSQWVRRELGIFENIADPALRIEGQGNRRFIFLMLEGENTAYSNLQMLATLKEHNAYKPEVTHKGADTVDPQVWHDVMTRLAEAIEDEDPSIPIPLAILSMTKAEFIDTDPDKKVDDLELSLNDLLKDINEIGSKNSLLGSYKEKRDGWQPYGYGLSARALLDNLLVDVNNAIPDSEPKFRWSPIDEKFWVVVQVREVQYTPAHGYKTNHLSSLRQFRDYLSRADR